MRHPEAFPPEMEKLPDGWEHEILGERYTSNPRSLVSDFSFELVELWFSCRDSMSGGYHAYPDGRSLLEEPALLLDAFGVIAKASSDLDKEDRAQDQQRP